MHDEDNDGKFPDESPVQPRGGGEQAQADRHDSRCPHPGRGYRPARAFSRPVVTCTDQGNGSLYRMIIGGPSHGAGDVGEELVRGDALGSRHPL